MFMPGTHSCLYQLAGCVFCKSFNGRCCRGVQSADLVNCQVVLCDVVRCSFVFDLAKDPRAPTSYLLKRCLEEALGNLGILGVAGYLGDVPCCSVV